MDNAQDSVVEEAIVADSIVAQPVATDPLIAEPIDTELVVAQPVSVEPAAEPAVAEPAIAEIAEVVTAEPVIAEQTIAEPVVTEPVAALEPVAEPAVPEPEPIRAEPVQAAVNPALATLQPKAEVRGKVVKIELYGAFVDIGVGQDGLLHISQISTERIKNVNDKLSVGDEITVWIRGIDAAQNRIDLTMIQPSAVDWNEISVGQVLTGKVIRLEKFGAFIDVGAERPGMVHVSELSSNFINSPADVVSVGQEIQVKVIKVSSKKKQIDLSVKALEEKVETPRQQQSQSQSQSQSQGDDDIDLNKMPTAMELALRGAMTGTEMAPLMATNKKSAKKDNRNDKNRQAQSAALLRTLQNRPK